jgi:hypothetical protein
MKANLTQEDIKELKYSCRPGILIATALFAIGLLGLLVKYLTDHNDQNIIPFYESKIFIIFGLLIFTSFLLGFSLTRKFFVDIRNGEKLLEKKVIQKKLIYVYHEPGSGNLLTGKKMKSVDSYNLIIDDLRYNVNKELFDKVVEGGTVYFHIAPISQELLQIDTEGI